MYVPYSCPNVRVQRIAQRVPKTESEKRFVNRIREMFTGVETYRYKNTRLDSESGGWSAF